MSEDLETRVKELETQVKDLEDILKMWMAQQMLAQQMPMLQRQVASRLDLGKIKEQMNAAQASQMGAMGLNGHMPTPTQAPPTAP